MSQIPSFSFYHHWSQQFSPHYLFFNEPALLANSASNGARGRECGSFDSGECGEHNGVESLEIFNRLARQDDIFLSNRTIYLGSARAPAYQNVASKKRQNRSSDMTYRCYLNPVDIGGVCRM